MSALATSSLSNTAAKGFIEGTFEPSRLRPDLTAKAAQHGLEKQLLESVGITSLGIAN